MACAYRPNIAVSARPQPSQHSARYDKQLLGKLSRFCITPETSADKEAATGQDHVNCNDCYGSSDARKSTETVVLPPDSDQQRYPERPGSFLNSTSLTGQFCPLRQGLDTREKHRHCCRALRSLARNYEEDIWRKLCCAISLLLCVTRSLRRNELSAATMLVVCSLLAHQPGEEYYLDVESSPEDSWLEAGGDILRVDGCGKVEFVNPSMEVFLRTFRVKGIDPSHNTIATACLSQVELNGPDAFLKQPQTVWKYKGSAFSAYAEENLDFHRGQAAKSRQLVTGIQGD